MMALKNTKQLSSVVNSLNKVQNKSDLRSFVLNEISSFFDFDRLEIFIVNKKDNEYSRFLGKNVPYTSDSTRKNDKNHNNKSIHSEKFKGSYVEALAVGTTPNLLDIKDNIDFWPIECKEAFLKSGLKQIMGISLRQGRKVIGVLCLKTKKENLYSKQNFHSFKILSQLITSVVCWLRTTEELAHQNRLIKLENTKIKNLLKIGEAIHRVSSTPELIRVLFGIIKKTFRFEDVGLFAFDIVNKKERDLVVDYEYVDNSLSTELIRDDGFTGWLPLSEITLFFANEGPLIMDVSEVGLRFNHPHFPSLLDQGYTQIIGGPLKKGNDIIGILCFWTKDNFGFNEKDLDFFKAICSQVSVSLDSIQTREKIILLNEQLTTERDYLIEEVRQEYNFANIIGESDGIKNVFKKIDLVAKTESTILINGETGTGKELIARAIHDNSKRLKKPLIKVNCATLPKDLIESELFGHEKGSFTGAHERRIGKFELADNGTLFLDEIGEIPIELQAKLLRAIQEKEIERIGGQQTIKVDVRIITATNRNLLEEIKKGSFRSDLYYRLNVFPILIPPLRDRKSDIPLLSDFFAKIYCKNMQKPYLGISKIALHELLDYNWPGNIRELQNIIERACIINTGKIINWGQKFINSQNVMPASGSGINEEEDIYNIKNIKQSRLDKEKKKYLDALEQTNWRIRGDGGTAELLNIKPTTLEYRLKKLGLK